MLKNKNLNLFLFPALIFFCVLFITAGTATANLCSSSVGPLAVPSVTAGTTIGATVDSFPFCGTLVSSPNVWYSVIGTGGEMTVDTCSGTTYDSKISVYSDGCSTLTCVAGNDDACGLQSSVSFASDAGTEYLILVHGWLDSVGNFNLTISSAPATTPTATTTAATFVDVSSGTLNGLVNANGEDSTVTFEYGLDTGYGSSVTADQSPVTGSTDTAVSAVLSSLAPGTTYHFRVVATNSSGTTNGSDMSFTTGVVAAAIPTLSEWGMIIMSLMMAGSAFWMMRRRVS